MWTFNRSRALWTCRKAWNHQKDHVTLGKLVLRLWTTGNHWDPWLLWFWSPQVFSAAGFNPESQSSPWCLWCLLILYIYIYMEHNLWTNQARIASWLEKMGKCFIFQQFHAIPTIGSLIISAGLVGCHRFSAPGSKSDQVLWGPQADLVSASRIRPFAAASRSF